MLADPGFEPYSVAELVNPPTFNRPDLSPPVRSGSASSMQSTPAHIATSVITLRAGSGPVVTLGSTCRRMSAASPHRWGTSPADAIRFGSENEAETCFRREAKIASARRLSDHGE